MPERSDQQRPYLLMLSVHGLIRGREPELGRDADTGGQVKYVLELVAALAARDDVGRIDLVTRWIDDPEVGPDYTVSEEPLAANARLVRLPCGPPEYLHKEALWDHLDSFADHLLDYLREQPRLPDLVHSHYADAGYAGTRVARHFGIPLVHTGHSLGRVKRRRLLAAGLDRDAIETRFNMAQRVNAEEETLATATRVITSTHQEIDAQYALYDHYRPEDMVVIPPGVDLERFHPPAGSERDSALFAEWRRFLRAPERPCVLAVARLDRRKNVATLVEAFGRDAALRERANLVLHCGMRDDFADLDDEGRDILAGILLEIDRHDLYGQVAYPKNIHPEDVPLCYRLAADLGGVFVNPALTEPFGLTLLEAAASGLPVVATEDGGPRDILANCRNGLLVDPLDGAALSAAIRALLDDSAAWRGHRDDGLAGVREHYSWAAHAAAYRAMLQPLLEAYPAAPPERPAERRPMLYHDRALFTDLDQSLIGDPAALRELLARLEANRRSTTFGIATGRRQDSALRLLRRHGIPHPDVLITSLGTAIHYAPDLTEDQAWIRHIDHNWNPAAVQRLLADLPGIERQPEREQSRFKVSYYIDPSRAPSEAELARAFHKQGLELNAFVSFGQYLDVVPARASKGFALRWFADRWEIPLERILVAGGSGGDEDMLRGNTLAVVVGNRHQEELSELAELDDIYFASADYARGVLEAIDHYRLFADPPGPV